MGLDVTIYKEVKLPRELNNEVAKSIGENPHQDFRVRVNLAEFRKNYLLNRLYLETLSKYYGEELEHHLEASIFYIQEETIDYVIDVFEQVEEVPEMIFAFTTINPDTDLTYWKQYQHSGVSVMLQIFKDIQKEFDYDYSKASETTYYYQHG